MRIETTTKALSDGFMHTLDNDGWRRRWETWEVDKLHSFFFGAPPPLECRDTAHTFVALNMSYKNSYFLYFCTYGRPLWRRRRRAPSSNCR